MRFLLDTNIFIYWATDKGLLSEDVYNTLVEYDAQLCVSAETVRELVISCDNLPCHHQQDDSGVF